MNKILKKSIKTGMLAITLLSVSTTSVVAAPKVTGGEKLRSTIEAQKQDKRAPKTPFDNDRMAKEKQSILDAREVNKLVEYEKTSGKKGYADYYGGAYIRDDGELVIQLHDSSNKEKKKLQAVTGKEVIFESVDNSYEDLVTEIQKDSEVLTQLVEKNASGKLPPNLSELAENIVAMETRVQDNVNVVYMTDISAEMQERYKEYFGDSEIVFKQSKPAQTTAFTIKQGDKVTTNGYSYGSIGPRMEYIKADGSSLYGFLTAGHVPTAKGESAYYIKPSGQLVNIGVVYKRKFSGSVDAAFIKITNSDCNMSRYTKYTSSAGHTGDSIKMCKECCYGTPIVGQTVYKSGAKSYLTASTVASLNSTVSYASEGVTLTNMIQTTSDFSDAGDSGSNVFVYEHGNVYESIGVISGGANGYCSYVSNIYLMDEAWRNSHTAPLYQY